MSDGPGRWTFRLHGRFGAPWRGKTLFPFILRARQTAITEGQEEPTIAGALAAAIGFGLKANESKKILREVFHEVGGWRKTGKPLRLRAATLDAYASAFEYSLMEKARSMVENNLLRCPARK